MESKFIIANGSIEDIVMQMIKHNPQLFDSPDFMDSFRRTMAEHFQDANKDEPVSTRAPLADLGSVNKNGRQYTIEEDIILDKCAKDRAANIRNKIRFNSVYGISENNAKFISPKNNYPSVIRVADTVSTDASPHYLSHQDIANHLLNKHSIYTLLRNPRQRWHMTDLDWDIEFVESIIASIHKIFYKSKRALTYIDYTRPNHVNEDDWKRPIIFMAQAYSMKYGNLLLPCAMSSDTEFTQFIIYPDDIDVQKEHMHVNWMIKPYIMDLILDKIKKQNIALVYNQCNLDNFGIDMMCYDNNKYTSVEVSYRKKKPPIPKQNGITTDSNTMTAMFSLSYKQIVDLCGTNNIHKCTPVNNCIYSQNLHYEVVSYKDMMPWINACINRLQYIYMGLHGTPDTVVAYLPLNYYITVNTDGEPILRVSTRDDLVKLCSNPVKELHTIYEIPRALGIEMLNRIMGACNYYGYSSCSLI